MTTKDFKTQGRSSGWPSRISPHVTSYGVSLTGVPEGAKLVLHKSGGKFKAFEMPVNDEEVYEIHSLLSRWLYAHYGQDVDDLLERHKERFGDWVEDEEALRVKEETPKVRRMPK